MMSRLGLLDGAVNAVVGHGIAGASIHGFIADIAKYLPDGLQTH